MSFGDPAFLALVKEEPCALLAHHGAQVGDYKSANFDLLGALAANTRNGREVLQAFAAAGGRGMVLSGSYFEPDEGHGGASARAFSPYGLSKGLTYQVFRYYAETTGLAFGKFVLPNPFGPYEEPRFTAYLIKTWREGKVAEVKTPDYVRDNIHVDLLAEVYRVFAERVAAQGPVLSRINPSGYAETQGAFAQRYAREMRPRLGWDCALTLGSQPDFAEPLERVNTEPATQWCPDWDEAQAWDGVADFYLACLE
jgi:nucleoside-diphosphate-sugar epimerase